jgi:hypothetical protein
MEAPRDEAETLHMAVNNHSRIVRNLTIFPQALKIVDENGKLVNEEPTLPQRMMAFIANPNPTVFSDEGIVILNHHSKNRSTIIKVF